MDVAFLLNPVLPKRYHAFLEFEKKGDYISISINALHHKKFGDTFISDFVDYINYLIINTNYNIILVPHDIRENAFGAYSDYQLQNIVYEKVNNPQRLFFFGDEKFITAPMLKHVAYNSNLVITGRMHYSIAALSNGVPVIVMAYQAKFEGMLLEIYDNIDNYVLDTDLFNLEELKTKTTIILANLEEEKKLIGQANIKEKAQKNLEGIA